MPRALEVDYDYQSISRKLSRELIRSRGKTMWRYRELLPLEGEPAVGVASGFTPLVRAERLGRALGLNQLYIKNDSVYTSRTTASIARRFLSRTV